MNMRIPISERHLGMFFHSFARLIGSGAPISASLVQASFGLDSQLQQICAEVSQKTQNGVPLFQALVPYRQKLPELVIPVLEVAEVSGTLEGACDRLAKAFSSMDSFRSRYSDVAIDPPKIILGAILFKIIFSGGAAPFDFVKMAVWTALQVSVVVYLVRSFYRWLKRYPRFLIFGDTVRLAIPHMGAIERNLAIARWARSFATMWNAGVPISQALDVSSRSALNAYYESEIQKAVVVTRQGRSISDSLATIQLVPDHLLSTLRIAEDTASFGTALDNLVEALEEEAVVKAAQESSGAIVVGYLIMGLMALFIAWASLAV